MHITWLIFYHIAFLIVSEVPIFPRYFDRNWPLLGRKSGFITLAILMTMLGVEVLGNLHCQGHSIKGSLGLAFWRIILSAGILALVMGGINIVVVSVFFFFFFFSSR